MTYSIFSGTLADLPWTEVERSIQAGAVVLLPTGVIEAHGPHLPLATDTYTAWLLCDGIRRELEARGVHTLIAPPCYWGINQATGGFPGSFSLRPETFAALLFDILACLKTWGVQHIFNIDAHGDPAHERVIFQAVLEARTRLGIDARAVVEDYKAALLGFTGQEAHILITPTPPLEGEMPEYAEIHAGAIETGLMLDHFADLVNTSLAQTLPPTRLTYADLPAWQQGGQAARALTPQGYFGAPASYARDRQAVRAYYDALPACYAQTIAGALASQPPDHA